MASVTTVRDITKTYRYYKDGTLANVSYSDDTPGVSFAYDDRFSRMTSATVTGVAAHAFTYRAVGQQGALQVEEEEGPYAAITYQYDNKGRQEGRKVDGSSNDYNWIFDQLGRVTSLTNKLGTFTIPSYDGVTGRPTKILYPNGQRMEMGYYANSEDRRLRRIRNLDADGTILSEFDYEAYYRDGQIRRILKKLDDGSKSDLFTATTGSTSSGRRSRVMW